MTTQIRYIDRDVVVALQREAENESEIDKLIRQITKAREELQITEANLAVLQESLAGKV